METAGSEALTPPPRLHPRMAASTISRTKAHARLPLPCQIPPFMHIYVASLQFKLLRGKTVTSGGAKNSPIQRDQRLVASKGEFIREPSWILQRESHFITSWLAG